MVEFVFTIVYLLAMVDLVFDGGYVMWVRESVRNGASEGIRAAQVWRPNAGRVSCVEYVAAAVDRTTLFNHTVTVSDNCTANPDDRIPSKALVSVEVITQHTPIMSLILFDPPLWFPLGTKLTTSHE